jgi:radical SAM protein with 4Fe4S-binding SPASM domain
MAKLINVDQPECIVDEGDGIRCKAGVTSFWMTWDGRMTPCGMMTTPVVYPLEVGFDAAWDQLRGQAGQIRTPAECVGCDHKELCSVCAAVCLTETGSFDKVPEYVCQRTKEIVKQTRQIREERNGK